MSEQEELRDFVRCPGNNPFCLGMTEYNCCGVPEGVPEPKRSKLSLAKTRAAQRRNLYHQLVGLMSPLPRKKLTNRRRGVFQ